MEATTLIDSIGLKSEFKSNVKQRDILFKLKNYINTLDIDIHVITKEKTKYDGTLIGLYHLVMYKNIELAEIHTGAAPSKNGILFYINIIFAGLSSHIQKKDFRRYEVLLSTCSWLNDKKIPFCIKELDVSMDVLCPFINIHVMQLKKVPNASNQIKDLYKGKTTYLQKKRKSYSYTTSAVLYDKQIKEGLPYDISRFEVRFLFHKDERDELLNLQGKITKGFERYGLFHFKDLKLKAEVMRHQNYIEYNGKPKARQYKQLVRQIEHFRLIPDLEYVMDYIYGLYSIKNYKMKPIEDKEVVSTFKDSDIDSWSSYAY